MFPSLRRTARDVLGAVPLLDGLFRRFVWSRLHFPEVELECIARLAPGSVDVAIDVGAAKGSYAWVMERVARRVYAFEPGESHYRVLRLAAYGSRVEAVQAAVGRTNGSGVLCIPGTNTEALHSATLSVDNQIARSSTSSTIEVRQISLDHFIEKHLVSDRHVDLLKIDVEGYELEVFAGAEMLLSHHHPTIVCEIEARHNPRYKDVFRFLRSLGYDAYFYRRGRFDELLGDSIADLQKEVDLRVRLSPDYRPGHCDYVNNFVFEHPSSSIRITVQLGR